MDFIKKRNILSQRPASLSQRPASLSQRPASLSQRPALLSQRPASLSKEDIIMLENINASESYSCSKTTKSKGFTLLMHLVLLTHKYPNLCAIINDYCKIYPEEVNKVLENKWSALMIASRNIGYLSSVESVKVLLMNGANPHITSYVENALKFTFINKVIDSYQATRLLLQYDIRWLTPIEEFIYCVDYDSEVLKLVHDINILNIKN